jgi:hypothetical protein
VIDKKGIIRYIDVRDIDRRSSPGIPRDGLEKRKRWKRMDENFKQRRRP